MKYYTMEHKGGLDQALKTKIQISETQFKEQFKKYNYKYYCYDERINCIRFIIDKMEKNYKEPTWLLIEI